MAISEKAVVDATLLAIDEINAAGGIMGKRIEPVITAVLLTGASSDGAYGMAVVRKLGGLAIAQDPKEAEYPMMPQSAIDNGGVDIILSLEEIGRFLRSSELERKTNKASYTEMRKD